jgi:hypothetical protein
MTLPEWGPFVLGQHVSTSATCTLCLKNEGQQGSELPNVWIVFAIQDSI